MARRYMLSVELTDDQEYEEAAAYARALVRKNAQLAIVCHPEEMHLAVLGERSLLTAPMRALCEFLSSEAWEVVIALKPTPTTPEEDVIREAERILNQG